MKGKNIKEMAERGMEEGQKERECKQTKVILIILVITLVR